ncbi:MAG: hypothetical protein M0R06_06930 [Sphaerochaeta sp.]|jgi:hypothetical protein|nr:hypothetical protein [Sphaerochaeta sp.]
MSEEKQDFVPKSEDVIRQEVTEELNFDAEADKERIEKVTKERLDHQEKLSTAIKQKQTHRSTAEAHEKRLMELGYDPKTGEKLNREPEKKDDKSDKKDEKSEVEKLREEMDNDRLERVSGDSEEAKKAIREYAKMNGVSYKEAAQSDYVQFQIRQEKEKKEAEQAAIGAGGGNTVKDAQLAELSPDQLSKLTPEQYAKWKAKNLK